jgi:hypothetical protein
MQILAFCKIIEKDVETSLEPKRRVHAEGIEPLTPYGTKQN